MLEKLKRAKKQFKNFLALAKGYGQWRAIKEWSSVDENGNPIPWYTYPTTEYLTHLNFKELSVFEYGSGNSTLWWAQKAKSIVSVEDDKDWYERVSSAINTKTIKYLFKTQKEEYITSALSSADVFIIDGMHRRECTEHIVKLGANGVMIILDNSDWHPKTIEYLRKNLNWIQIDFHDFGPINDYTWTTSIFLNPLRYKDLTYNAQLKSKCGLLHITESES